MNEFMDVAIDLSDDNFDKNYGGPFGACVIKDGKIIGKGINRVIKDNDPKGIISQVLLTLRVNKDLILPEFLKYFFLVLMEDIIH